MTIVKKVLKITFKNAPFFTLFIFSVGIFQALGNGIIVVQTQRAFDLIDKAIDNQHFINYAFVALLLLFVMTILIHLINGFQNYLYDVFIMLSKNKFMHLIGEKSTRLKALDFEDAAFLDLLNKTKTGMENSIELVLVFGDIFTYYLPYFLFMLFYLYSIKPLFAVFIMLIFIPVLIAQVIRIKIFSDLEHRSANYRRRLKYFDSCISDKIYVKESRALNATGFFIKKLKSTLTLLNNEESRTHIKMSLIEIMLDSITLIGYIAIVLILVIAFKNQEISLGALVAIYTSLSKIFAMMEEILRYQIGYLTENIGSVQNFLSYLEYPETHYDTALSDVSTIELKNVSFNYPGVEEESLKDIHLKIDAHQTVALVGANGSGKTTLSKIIMGLYPPTKGTILINNTLVLKGANYKKSCLFQDFQKYQMHLADNIKIADLTDDYPIASLARQFNLDTIDPETILSTELGGIDLSIGQWQRVSMARAFYRDAGVMVLDEPTASIDPIEENHFYEKFNTLTTNKMSIIITHHLVSAKHADLIVVLKQGSVIEKGTHSELIKLGGEYAEMFNAQKQSY